MDRGNVTNGGIDRCDEWYHTACVNMPDLEVDLVDQFFCPPCIASSFLSLFAYDCF